ncbi:monosaccharide-sensing protein 2 [Selaginella moellendorffii]|uniref:monosaccharide-sensing protein 2 n=1 Tax=Selaginella moellendorffii TaxID=88036 RepID=UPI000D1CF68D|nr:monosaccharide-sensing protein 2 [Selaginella moellendorffii]XP_024540279.1 monosaccharide-sensing protein 2 [Selaginella moellendorffii]|eukprot:XP_024540278.1 monosaccharide-sensing protein 2 [Selaginella moellendorffii]
MQGATKIALAAALGNLLQGWDNGAIAGALLYIKPEFHLEDKPTIEGFVVASTLLGAVCSTVCAGPGADWLGRKLMLILSSALFSVSSCAMLWSPSVYALIASRFLVGTGIGLVVTIVPIYIAETAPSEIRGQLATFPQLLGSGGLFVVYIMVFFLSLTADPSWRMMLGVLLIPALLYLALVIFYLPESPRWLVSKGRMLEAKYVLQRLRDRDDVSAELALLVEGLGVGGEASLEEWLLKPAPEDVLENGVPQKHESQIKLYSPEEGIAWIATPVVEEPAGHSLVPTFPSFSMKSVHLMDPLVQLIGSVQQTQEHHQAVEGHERDYPEEPHFKEEEDKPRDNGYESDMEEGVVGNLDESNLEAPLLHKRSGVSSRDNSGAFEDVEQGHETVPERRGSRSNLVSRGSMHHGSMPESLGSVGIGGGWQLAWQWSEPEQGTGHTEEGGFRRVFLLQEAVDASGRIVGSTASLPGIAEGDSIPAAAIIGHPAQSMRDIIGEAPVGPAMLHPTQTATSGPAWSDIFVGGVKRALIVGLSLQVLQQFSGINAVLYFIPQILQQSGLAVLLSDAGINANSASILGSAATSLLMLPCIVLAMRLMDHSGRRQLLLSTLPVLLLALVAVTFSNNYLRAGLVQAVISFLSVTLYACSFVMGFGPIPNILCSEIFPTRVRGLCIAMCQATFWVCNIIVTYLFPILLVRLGLGGVFSLFALVCLVSWIFIFLKVPETKGLPLEVISEFFAMTDRLEAKKSST